jgi:hypothetical protein
MDPQVQKALAKWPNVPHCYGWLALDARGSWRMRDEQAQKSGGLGERITQATLTAFINRNYLHDEAGKWYFQNGPQRVYVELQAAPYIARIEPGMKLVLHTGTVMQQPNLMYLSDGGNLWLCSENEVAMLDDRDLSHCLPLLSLNEKALDEAALQAWMDSAPSAGQLKLKWHEISIPVERLVEAEAPGRFSFVRSPQASMAAESR